jgi:glycosyltransferase involved in cell wall biosynthesis
MKILYIISSLEIGGAQRLLSDFLPLMACEHDISLLVNQQIENDFSRKIRSAGVRIINCGCPNIYSLKNILIIAKMAEGYDIVHVHLFPTVYWAAIASLISHINLVYTEHSTSNRRRDKWYFRTLERFVYSRYRKIVSVSQQTQMALLKWLKAKESDSRFVVVNNGVNISSFQNIRERSIYPHTLIMVSRFVASKDQLTVIKAMKLLSNDVHVIFVGDGENLEVCKKFARSEGLSERAHFIGKQTNVASWIAKADLGIQSSIWEGFGLTAIEMMAAGKPVVATDVDGLKQVVEGAGVIFPVGDYRALAAHVNRLLTNKEEYILVSEKCRKRAEMYDIKSMVSAYESLYTSLII